MQWLVFSPDSRTLASAECGTGEIQLWDVSSGRLRGWLQHSGSAEVISLFFTPDGRHLAATRYRPNPGVTGYNWWDVSRVSDSVSDRDRPVFPLTAPDDPVRKAFTPVNERLGLLADAIDGAPLGALSVLEQTWIRRPPCGVSVTRDRRLAVIGHGDRTFTVQRFWSGWTLLIGRIESWGTSIVIIDPTKWEDRHQPMERERIARVATLLVPAAPGNAKTLIPS